jgi:hypothetical protein
LSKASLLLTNKGLQVPLCKEEERAMCQENQMKVAPLHLLTLLFLY